MLSLGAEKIKIRVQDPFGEVGRSEGTVNTQDPQLRAIGREVNQSLTGSGDQPHPTPALSA